MLRTVCQRCSRSITSATRGAVASVAPRGARGCILPTNKTSPIAGETSTTPQGLKTVKPEVMSRESGASEVMVSTDTLQPGLKNPSDIKSWWYGPSWWDAGTGPEIHDQDLIPETASQRKYKLATILVTGIVSAFVVLEADFGENEHCFSPLRRYYQRVKEAVLEPSL